MIFGSLAQVLNTVRSVRFHKKGELMTATLYVGNLELNANNYGLHKALSILFKKGVAEDITIPRWNSGFAFIKLSWAIGAQVKMRDLCISQSANIQLEANSRPTYFRELHSKADSPSSTPRATYEGNDLLCRHWKDQRIWSPVLTGC